MAILSAEAVVRAKAGIQRRSSRRHWVPSPLSGGLKAAGMTTGHPPAALRFISMS